MRLGIVGDEESEEEVERGSDHLVDSGFVGDFAITGEPTDLHIGVEAKGVLALRVAGERRRGPRGDALARRQRRSAGARRFPQYRVATVRSAQLGAVRPPLDQPRPDPGWRRAQQGARPMRHRRRHPLPARPGPRQRAGAGRGRARGRGRAALHPPAGRGRPRAALRAGAARGGDGASRRRADERGARRRLRRGLLPAGRGACGRVRAARRRASRAGGVGLGSSLHTYRQTLESFLRSLPARLDA